MISEHMLISVLSALNIVQLIYWGYHCHTLINKLMSRNFAEYDLVKKGPAKVNQFEALDEEAEQENQSILSELNGLLPR